MNVRRPPGVVMVAPGVLAGADGHEAIAALRIGERMAGTREIWVQRSVVLIAFMQITAGRVRLPDLDQRIPHGASVFVYYSAADHNAFPERLARVLLGKIAGLHIYGLLAE